MSTDIRGHETLPHDKSKGEGGGFDRERVVSYSEGQEAKPAKIKDVEVGLRGRKLLPEAGIEPATAGSRFHLATPPCAERE